MLYVYSLAEITPDPMVLKLNSMADPLFVGIILVTTCIKQVNSFLRKAFFTCYQYITITIQKFIFIGLFVGNLICT